MQQDVHSVPEEPRQEAGAVRRRQDLVSSGETSDEALNPQSPLSPSGTAGRIPALQNCGRNGMK